MDAGEGSGEAGSACGHVWVQQGQWEGWVKEGGMVEA